MEQIIAHAGEFLHRPSIFFAFNGLTCATTSAYGNRVRPLDVPRPLSAISLSCRPVLKIDLQQAKLHPQAAGRAARITDVGWPRERVAKATSGPGPPHERVEQVLMPAAAYDECSRSSAHWPGRSVFACDTLLLTLAALPVTVVDPPEYDGQLRKANSSHQPEIPTMWSVLTLALHLKLPVWTNDDDFDPSGLTRLPLLARRA